MGRVASHPATLRCSRAMEWRLAESAAQESVQKRSLERAAGAGPFWLEKIGELFNADDTQARFLKTTSTNTEWWLFTSGWK